LALREVVMRARVLLGVALCLVVGSLLVPVASSADADTGSSPTAPVVAGGRDRIPPTGYPAGLVAVAQSESSGYGGCAGLAPTITGSPGDDVIFGTDGRDVIVGLAGDDRIFGRGGDDVVCGGDGADVLVGHQGADHLIGGVGDDRLEGRSGPDVLEGSDGSDRLLGGGAGDELLGGEGDDVLRGGPGGDHLDGGPGTDILNGSGGLDVLTDTPGTYPHPRVGVGTDGWLYLADEFVHPCENTVAHRDMAALANLIARIVAASGRTPIVLLAPGKDAIHPEHLGDLAGDAACAAERRRELRAAFVRAGIPGWIDMWGILRRRALVEETYYPLDSHWTTLGGLLVTKQVVNKLEPGLWTWQEVTTRQETAGGTQAHWIGSTATLPVIVYRVDRGGEVTQLDTEGRHGPNRYEATAPGGVAAVDVFMVHDSFGNPVEMMLPQYTTASTFANWSVFATRADRYDRLAETVAAHDVFVMESSERGSYRRFGTTFVPLAPALIRALAGDLPGDSVDLAAATGSGWTLDSGSIVPTAPNPVVELPVLAAVPPGTHRYLTVTVVAESEDPVQLHTGKGEVVAQGAPQQMVSGSTHVLVWDLSAVGGPRVLTLLPNTATITEAVVVDIP
jgi:hypothetical protein